MPGKSGEGYAKAASSIQRIIRQLADDDDETEDPDFRARNIQRLQDVANDFNRHTMTHVKKPASPSADDPPKQRTGTTTAEP